MMMTLLQWSAWLMLMACGLWAGVILTFQVERINLWARMPIEQFAVDFRRSLFRVDPLQPILAALASIVGGYFAWFSLGTPRLLAWVGVALMVFVVVASIVIAEPINSRFRDLPEGQLPDGAERYRIAWRRFHTARTIFTLAAFACCAGAVVASA
jgi:uncharacterized membrane protein